MGWNTVINSQLDGGLGIGGLSIQNSALVAKWGWCYFMEPLSNWNWWFLAFTALIHLIGIHLENIIPIFKARDQYISNLKICGFVCSILLKIWFKNPILASFLGLFKGFKR